MNLLDICLRCGDPPLPKPLDPGVIIAFFAIMFRSGGGAAALLVMACIVASPPPPNPRACPMVALLGACCPYDAGSKMELPSSRTNLLFLSKGVISSNDASTLLDGDWEPAFKADPDGTIFPFPLSKLEVVPVFLQPSVASVLRMWTPQDVSPAYRTVMSILSSVGICFNSSDLTAWSKKIGW
jgi:hypothetical protein